MRMKISVILIEKSLATLMAMLVQFQSSYFFHKFHSNALPLKEALLSGNENLKRKKLFCDQNFITMGMNETLIKFYTINHSNYQPLVPLTKRAVRAYMNTSICKGLTVH